MRVTLAVLLAASAVLADEPLKLPDSPEDLARGKSLYLGGCTYCHGPTGDGGKGANLARRDLTRAKTDADLVAIIQTGIPGSEMPGAHHMTPNEIRQTAAFVRSLGRVETGPVPGDPARGQALYGKLGCANCHTVEDNGTFRGGFTGPDLSRIGSMRSPKYLRESIISPAAAIPEQYTPVEVVLKDGRRVSGRRLHEDTFSIQVRDLGGQNHSFLKSQVRDIVKDRKKSPMPGFRDKLQAADLDDLVAYLVSLKERP